jgi:hypothetical protein
MNCTIGGVPLEGVPAWVSTAVAGLGGQTGVVVALVSTFASVGFVSFCVILPYLFRICRGQDIVSECLIGKSVVTLSIDATGNGLHAAKKLVVDLNHRHVGVVETGGTDSPPRHGTDHHAESGDSRSDK